MTISAKEKNTLIKNLLNGTYTSLKTVIPVDHQIAKPTLLNKYLELQFGVLIGITGDVRGQLILSGEQHVFGSIGKAMFGADLEGDMLMSFSGELGNMIAGSLSTNIVVNGIKTDITSPTILQGSTTLSGYDKAIHTIVKFAEIGQMDIYLLLD